MQKYIFLKPHIIQNIPEKDIWFLTKKSIAFLWTKIFNFDIFFIKNTFYDFYIWIFQGFKYIFVNVLILDRILDVIFSFFLEKFVWKYNIFIFQYFNFIFDLK